MTRSNSISTCSPSRPVALASRDWIWRDGDRQKKIDRARRLLRLPTRRSSKTARAGSLGLMAAHPPGEFVATSVLATPWHRPASHAWQRWQRLYVKALPRSVAVAMVLDTAGRAQTRDF